jgi:hypothetical protein
MPQYCQEDNGYRCAVTSMSLDDSVRFLYITGLSMPRLERSLVFGDSTVNSFFNTAFMAVADIDQSVSVSAVSISDYGVALPVSIMPISTVWVFCKKADINSSGTVDIEDLSILVDQWLQAPGIPSADISPAPDGDDTVNLQDFELFAQCWLTIVRMN